MGGKTRVGMVCGQENRDVRTKRMSNGLQVARIKEILIVSIDNTSIFCYTCLSSTFQGVRSSRYSHALDHIVEIFDWMLHILLI